MEIKRWDKNTSLRDFFETAWPWQVFQCSKALHNGDEVVKLSKYHKNDVQFLGYVQDGTGEVGSYVIKGYCRSPITIEEMKAAAKGCVSVEDVIEHIHALIESKSVDGNLSSATTSATTSEEQPYLIEVVIKKKRSYNPKYGDDRVCECGHPYYRHFDSYEDNYPCGCKYCQCFEFKERTEGT